MSDSIPLRNVISGPPELDLKLGDIVRVNSSSKYYGDWQGLKLRIVGLRLDLDSNKIHVEVLEVGCKHGTADGWSPEELTKEKP